MVSTEAQKRASKKAHEKKLRDGFKRQWFYLSPEGQNALVKLTATYGSQTGAVNFALTVAAAALTPPVQDTAGSQKPVHKSLTKAAEADPKPKRAQTPAPARKAATDDPQRSSVDDEPLRFPRAPIGSLAKKPKGSKR